MNTQLPKFMWLQLYCFLLLSFTANAQLDSASVNMPPALADCMLPIKGNNYKFYFRTDYKLTSPACASFYRESAFDKSKMVFNGPFKDYRSDGTAITEGAYKNGELDGPFIVRYMSGKTWQKGTYREGEMVGTWEYFYPSGEPMYTFEIKNDNVWLQQVWDIDGKPLVENGNGTAKIYNYNGRDVFSENMLYWSGKVENGLMQGKWRRYKNGKSLKLMQLYKDSKFVKGFDNGRMYNTMNYLYLGQEQTILNAVALQTAACEENPDNDLLPRYANGSTQLRRDLYKYTDKHMHGVVKSGEVDISFDVDVKGNLSDFKINSETGVENLLVEALKELGPWLPATKSYKPVAQRITYSFYYQTMWDREHNKQPVSKKAWKHREPVHYEPRDPWRPKIKSNAYGM